MFVYLLAISIFRWCITLSVRPYVHLSLPICLFAYLPVYLLVYLPFNQSFHLPLYLPVFLPVFLSAYLPTFSLPASLPSHLYTCCMHDTPSVL